MDRLFALPYASEQQHLDSSRRFRFAILGVGLVGYWSSLFSFMVVLLVWPFKAGRAAAVADCGGRQTIRLVFLGRAWLANTGSRLL